MEANESLDYIFTETCDCCGTRGAALLHHHNGTPVLAVCQACGPINFEMRSRQDIDAWLAGGDTFAFGR